MKHSYKTGMIKELDLAQLSGLLFTTAGQVVATRGHKHTWLLTMKAPAELTACKGQSSACDRMEGREAMRKPDDIDITRQEGLHLAIYIACEKKNYLRHLPRWLTV